MLSTKVHCLMDRNQCISFRGSATSAQMAHDKCVFMEGADHNNISPAGRMIMTLKGGGLVNIKKPDFSSTSHQIFTLAFMRPSCPTVHSISSPGQMTWYCQVLCLYGMSLKFKGCCSPLFQRIPLQYILEAKVQCFSIINGYGLTKAHMYLSNVKSDGYRWREAWSFPVKRIKYFAVKSYVNLTCTRKLCSESI